MNLDKQKFFSTSNVKDGGYDKRTAIVDTGAQVSLFSSLLMNVFECKLSERGSFVIEQAGVAEQSFQAIEAYITLFLEDAAGSRTEDFIVRTWFAGTHDILIGFEGILDRAILHLDMPRLTGYLEFPEPKLIS